MTEIKKKFDVSCLLQEGRSYR